MKKYILLSIIIAFGFSFSLFLFFQQANWDTLNPNTQTFYLQNSQENDSKILLIGSSHIGMLNATSIELVINKKYPDYSVYNLAISSDKPSKRIHELEQIISLNPKLIIYGVGYRDFSNEQFDSNFLPDPKYFIGNYFFENSPIFLDNPKLITLNGIKNTLGYQNIPENLEKNTPFFPYKEEYSNIIDLNELEKKANSGKSIKISSIKENKDLIALNKIFSILNENNIENVLLLTPHNSHFVNSISENNKENFSKIIDDISLNNSFPINSLMKNYSNSNIWISENHISHGVDGIQYNNDVGQIILLTLEK